MNPLRPIFVALCVLPALGLFAAVAATPDSASALRTIEITSSGQPVRLSPSDLGVEHAGPGLQINEAKFDHAVGELADIFSAPATPATYQLVGDHVVLKPGRTGIALDRPATKELLLRALQGATSNLVLPVKKTVAPPAAEHVIVVYLSKFRLDLYRRTQLSEHFPVGVGALRFPTPPGAYYIKSKTKNPSWSNPGSSWSRGMPRYLPPGPRNPLGSRAMRLDRGALVIHGTPQPWSVGRRSSHGCMRMLRADVQKLYDIVAVGTPVFIVP